MTNQQYIEFYLEWFNDFLSVDKFAAYHMISTKKALKWIFKGKELYKLNNKHD